MRPADEVHASLLGSAERLVVLLKGKQHPLVLKGELANLLDRVEEYETALKAPAKVLTIVRVSEVETQVFGLPEDVVEEGGQPTVYPSPDGA